MREEKKFAQVLEDIDYALVESSDEDFLSKTYKEVMGREIDSKTPISDILACLEEAHEDFVCETYTKILSKKCAYDEERLVFLIENL